MNEPALKLPQRVSNLAHADIRRHHLGRAATDLVFIVAVLRAQDRVCLELLKARFPGERCCDRWGRFGFLPSSFVTFSQFGAPPVQVERILTARNFLRRSRKFEQADLLRGRAAELGFEIGDEPGGTNWLRL